MRCRINILCGLFLLMFIFCLPCAAQAKKVNGQTVYSEKTVDARIKTIQDYYYNKQSQLKVIKNKCTSTFGGEKMTVQWYFHGSDLMFAYGSNNKYQVRAYYYKNQMVRMLVDQKGYSRKTYKQKYNDWRYMQWNLKGSVQIGNQTTVKTGSPKSGNLILVTKVTKTSVTYYKLNSKGPDGCIWYVSPTRYKASLTDNCKFYDGGDDPNSVKKISYSKFKKLVDGCDVGMAVDITCTGGKIKRIELPYWA